MPLDDAVEPTPRTRYAAFISYSHHDRKAAQWLHRALETYTPPRDLASQGYQHSSRFFWIGRNCQAPRTWPHLYALRSKPLIS